MQAVLPYLNVAQILVSLFLMGLILMQTRGTGMASGFSADSSIYRTRRGIEKTIFQLTVIVGVVFLVLAIVSVIVPRFEA